MLLLPIPEGSSCQGQYPTASAVRGSAGSPERVADVSAPFSDPSGGTAFPGACVLWEYA